MPEQRPTSVNMSASDLIALLQGMEEEIGSLPIGDPFLKDIITFIDALRTRVMLNVIGRTCDRLGIPYQFIEHASRSVSAAEKAALIASSDPIYNEARERMGCIGWPIVVIRTLFLATDKGHVLFAGREGDSYDDHRMAIAEKLEIFQPDTRIVSGKGAKRIRVASEDQRTVTGMELGVSSPIIEPPYWKNIRALFLVGEAFSGDEAFIEVAVNRRYGLLLWAPALPLILPMITPRGYPSVYIL